MQIILNLRVKSLESTSSSFQMPKVSCVREPTVCGPVAMQNGHELGRAPVSEERVGNHAQIILGRNFSGNFEIYFTDF